MSSESTFAYSLKYNTRFIVKNITGYTDEQILEKYNLVFSSEVRSPKKTISIFNYPINAGQTRDLLQIPGIQEADIRASLLKGVLRHKFLCGDIIIEYSDIDLLQFNDEQKLFLQKSGISKGLQVDFSNFSVIRKEDIQLVGAVDDVNVIYTIPSGNFIQNNIYKIIVYKNGVKQFYLDDYLIAESGGPGTGYDTVILTVPPMSSLLPIDIITADYYIVNS